MITLFIEWNIDPQVFPGSSIPVRWYGLLFALAFVSAYLIMKQMFKREGLSVKALDDLTLYVGIATVIGARLGHCLFYEPEIYLRDPVRILKIWEGGLASHGAAVGILIALWLYTLKHKHSLIRILDMLSVVVPLSGSFIRFGNLANSEIYGKITTLPWGFYFRQSQHFADRLNARHPTQIYEALSYILITILLWVLYRKGFSKRKGFLFGLFLALLFTVRFLIEFVKEPQVAFESDMVLNMGQLLSLPFAVAGIIIMVWSYRKVLPDAGTLPNQESDESSVKDENEKV